jgi:transmembrane sensor
MDKTLFKQIIEKWETGTASEEEIQFLEKYYLLFDQEDDGIERLSIQEKMQLEREMKSSIDRQTIAGRKGSSVFSLPIKRMIAAAVIIFTVATVGWLFYRDKDEKPAAVVHLPEKVQDIDPGGNKATLTLADGSVVVLDETPKGVVGIQEGIKIRKTADGTVEYDFAAQSALPNDKNNSAKLQWNTVSTPMGGQYRLKLPDGTQVWLNAASSVEFPIKFSTAERVVKLRGEAYFEVTNDQNRPFKVLSNDQEIKVLGTHFNVNTYPDEPGLTTTLVEGRIQVSIPGQQKILTPGEQAFVKILTQNGSNIQIDPNSKIELTTTDVEAATAWKDGYFKFNKTDLPSIMRQISRWYDVEIEFKGRVPNDLFVGKINRTEKVSGVLRLLELSGVHFSIEGKRIIVSTP